MAERSAREISMALRSNCLILSVGLSLVACGAAMAMQPAATKPGYEAGAGLGATFTQGTRIAGEADVDAGFKTNIMGQAYTDGVIDFLSVGRAVNVPGGPVDIRASILTAGVRQPLDISGSIPIAVEGGLSYLNVTNGGGSSTSGFIGGRATWAQGSAVGITGMFRYHFESGGFWQAGAGLSGPLGKGTGLYYQADYYHTGGGGLGSETDTILVGARISGNL
jgi:hypothetical protein